MFEEAIAELMGNAASEPLLRVLLFLMAILITRILSRRIHRLIVGLFGSFFDITKRLSKTTFPFEKQLNQGLIRPTQLFIVAIGLRLALAFIGLPPTIATIADLVTLNLLTFSVTWAIFHVADIVAQYYVVHTEKDDAALDPTIARFVRHVIQFIIMMFGGVLILQQWGQDVGGLIAGLGIASLAVALAAQETLANVIGYFAIITDAPFKVGDFIIIEGVVKGRIEDISFRSTRIRAIDNSIMIIPNRVTANANITNWARSRKRRIDMIVGITYSSTAEQIKQVIKAIHTMLDEHEDISADRIVVDFVEFGDSSLNIRVSFMVKSYSWEDLEAVKTDINLKIMDILKAIGVEVAFPTRTVHMIDETQRETAL